MIKIYDGEKMPVSEILGRKDEMNEETEKIEKIVRDIIDDVRKNGDNALFRYCEKFDKAKLTALKVSDDEIKEALREIDDEFLAILEEAKENIEAFHRLQKRSNFIKNDRDGVILGQKIMSVEKAGLYVPGGTASYPSSVLMNAVPAQIAGVKKIVMVTPPSKSGKIAPQILAAAHVAGVHEIYKVGGAQAIAALAYGTETIPKVDKIVGPGNIFVATAKKAVFGTVSIDMVAGPSEILVIADETCNPKYVAADMLSQAEHDKMASSILITNSSSLAKEVQAELEVQIPLLPRAEICRASIDNNGKIIVVNDIKDAIDTANAIAPEHLELCVREPFMYLNDIKNAGSIFLGKNVPEALGDYFAGPNHTLPTMGTARFSSPLGVDDFIKKSSFIYYTEDALKKDKDKIVSFAKREGLDAHAKSISIRFQ